MIPIRGVSGAVHSLFRDLRIDTTPCLLPLTLSVIYIVQTTFRSLLLLYDRIIRGARLMIKSWVMDLIGMRSMRQINDDVMSIYLR